MAGFRAVAVFGLTVPPGDKPTAPFDVDGGEYPATFRITMAAIDPTAKPAPNGAVNGEALPRATLKMIRLPYDGDSEDDDNEDSFNLEDMLDDEAAESDSDGEVNGGPSDPQKSPKARRKAAVARIKEELGKNELEPEHNGINGTENKGKGKATDLDENSDKSDGEEEEEEEEEFVLCTLDPSKKYQQTLDITIAHDEQVLFKVSGTHSIYLTGNILVPESSNDVDMFDSEDDEEGFDFPPDADEEYDLPDDDDESDELDDLENPRIKELGADDDDEMVPKLVKAQPDSRKGKNKRAAADSDDESVAKPTADSILAKSLKAADPAEAIVNGEAKLSKKQQKALRKKQKDNAGNAVEPTAATKTEDLGIKQANNETIKDSPGKSDKKVQFAKTLVQGPSSASSPNVDVDKAELKTRVVEPLKNITEKIVDSAKAITNKIAGTEAATLASDKTAKPGLGVKTVNGVTIDDKKLGTGPAAKKGDKVSMRYIGKLEKDKKVFDSNKKGKPFTFKLGAGEVIKGWDIGVMGMTVGGERKITIPAHLAYGSKAQTGIPANSVLTFDLKVLDIK